MSNGYDVLSGREDPTVFAYVLLDAKFAITRVNAPANLASGRWLSLGWAGVEELFINIELYDELLQSPLTSEHDRARLLAYYDRVRDEFESVLAWRQPGTARPTIGDLSRIERLVGVRARHFTAWAWRLHATRPM